MPRCGTTCDENSVAPWTRGDFRGVLGGQTYPPRLPPAATPPTEGIFRRGFRHSGARVSPRWIASGVSLDHHFDQVRPAARNAAFEFLRKPFKCGGATSLHCPDLWLSIPNRDRVVRW
jgi:hypothetical protein